MGIKPGSKGFLTLPSGDKLTISGFTVCASPITADAIKASMDKMRALLAQQPKPLAVIYATPEGMARLPKVYQAQPGMASPFCFPHIRLGNAIPVVELPSVADCQAACEKAINEGRRAAVLTDYNFFDPCEAAREARL